ncbi:hypothetical protein CEUSTIGMA_g6846.t1 [Chlamydomonas eustigma]|uniref:Uncharacterized protein n=1 Tax=Chlamydomonas eustigma TaxID=1157962 RepID=A0A250X8K6_9CHLO|nr:hypothetical protein CEUSTIGMA_g6846.t1 [Chlamydomonas eustigma]|eukprot:GAX79405.1 hypothetical protein CEUSTIGMA_g6846.t1 [Chlamydomonas eustigma]
MTWQTILSTTILEIFNELMCAMGGLCSVSSDVQVHSEQVVRVEVKEMVQLGQEETSQKELPLSPKMDADTYIGDQNSLMNLEDCLVVNAKVKNETVEIVNSNPQPECSMEPTVFEVASKLEVIQEVPQAGFHEPEASQRAMSQKIADSATLPARLSEDTSISAEELRMQQMIMAAAAIHRGKHMRNSSSSSSVISSSRVNPLLSPEASDLSCKSKSHASPSRSASAQRKSRIPASPKTSVVPVDGAPRRQSLPSDRRSADASTSHNPLPLRPHNVPSTSKKLAPLVRESPVVTAPVANLKARNVVIESGVGRKRVPALVSRSVPLGQQAAERLSVNINARKQSSPSGERKAASVAYYNLPASPSAASVASSVGFSRGGDSRVAPSSVYYSSEEEVSEPEMPTESMDWSELSSSLPASKFNSTSRCYEDQDVDVSRPSPSLHQHLYPGYNQPLPSSSRTPAIPPGLAHQLPPTKFERVSNSDHGSRRQSIEAMLNGGGAVSGGGSVAVGGMHLSIIMERCGSPGNDGSVENGATGSSKTSQKDIS